MVRKKAMKIIKDKLDVATACINGKFPGGKDYEFALWNLGFASGIAFTLFQDGFISYREFQKIDFRITKIVKGLKYVR